MQRFIVSFFICLYLSSCAHVISRESREVAVKDVPFSKLLTNTDAYINNIFIFGGIISQTTNKREGTEIEVVQTPVDRFGNMLERDVSEGRCIIISAKQLDPLIYRNGRFITFAGKLTGSKKKMLGELEYSYPVFEVTELYLWREERYYLYEQGYPYNYWYTPYYPYTYYWFDPFRLRPNIYIEPYR